MVKDLSEIFTAIKDLAKEASKTAKTALITPKRSISKSAMDAIANFPVCVEDSLTLDEGMMICRALEKRFATFLMMVMQMQPKIDSEDDMVSYLKQFHQNMDTPIDPMGGTDYALSGDKVKGFLGLGESLGIEYDTFVSEAAMVLGKVYQGIDSRNINMESAKLNFTIESATNETVLNDIGKVVFEATGHSRPRHARNDERSSEGSNSNNKPFDPKQREPLVDQKRFEKANDVVPTLLHVRVFPKNKGYSEPIDFVIGVKATLHPVRQNDMLLNLVRGLKNEDKFFNFLRWTTGEIKFFKDFLFGIDQMKLDAVTSSSSSNALFSMGRRRKSLSVMKNYFTNDSLLPNMTIVVTTDCLNRLKDEYGYDIGMNAGSSQIALIKKMMNTYFLLSFVIVDQGLGRVNILLDGQNQFENYTYSNLQKEGTVNDRQFKEMMKMLGRSV